MSNTDNNSNIQVRSIRRELEEINMGVVTREGEEREEVRIVPLKSKSTLEYEDAFHTYLLHC